MVVGSMVGAGVVSLPARFGQAIADGFSIDSGISEIDRLLSRGGMSSMLPTLRLIMGAGCS
jgi:Na+/H+ antiporter NhaC